REVYDRFEQRARSEHGFELRERTRPLRFAIQMALVAVWRSWGIIPDQVFGDGDGEAAAACVSGVLDADEVFRQLSAGERVAWPATTRPEARALIVDIGASLDVSSTVADVYVHGARLDLASWDAPWPRQKLALPTYPFQRKRYWVDPVVVPREA